MKIYFDPKWNLALFDGPGGFTQQQMLPRDARAIAVALNVPFVMCKPGTHVPEERGPR